MNKGLLISLVLICAVPAFVFASNQSVNQTNTGLNQGGFGEFGGQVTYILPSGSSHTEYWTLVNKFNYPVSFYIVPPAFNSSPTPPNLAFSVMNGTIPADSNLTISVIATAPQWTSYIFATKNSTWSGYATAYATSASSATGGASIALGTAKLITITAEPPHVLPGIMTVIAAIVIIAAIAYYFSKRNKAPVKAKESKAAANASKAKG